MGAENVVTTFIVKDFILRLKCTRKRLVARLRLDPLGSMGASSESLTAIGGHGMKHSLAAVRGAVQVTGKSKLRCLGRNGKG